MSKDCPKKGQAPIKAIEDRPAAFFGQVVGAVSADGYTRAKKTVPARPVPQGTFFGEIIDAAFKNKFEVLGCVTEAEGPKRQAGPPPLGKSAAQEMREDQMDRSHVRGGDGAQISKVCGAHFPHSGVLA